MSRVGLLAAVASIATACGNGDESDRPPPPADDPEPTPTTSVSDANAPTASDARVDAGPCSVVLRDRDFAPPFRVLARGLTRVPAPTARRLADAVRGDVAEGEEKTVDLLRIGTRDLDGDGTADLVAIFDYGYSLGSGSMWIQSRDAVVADADTLEVRWRASLRNDAPEPQSWECTSSLALVDLDCDGHRDIAQQRYCKPEMCNSEDPYDPMWPEVCGDDRGRTRERRDWLYDRTTRRWESRDGR